MIGSRAAGPVFLSAAILFGGLVVFKTTIQPWQRFGPETTEYLFERDAASGRLPVIPPDFFSVENVERYHRGDGFKAIFRVVNDPRKNYEMTEDGCGVESWEGSYGEMDNRLRRTLVAQRQAEFRGCLDRFKETFQVVQTIEIGLDDTEGVDDGLRNFVSLKLEERLGDPERFLISGEATQLTTRLVFFRISADPVPRRLSWEVNGSTPEAAKKMFENGLKWLLAPAERKEETALAANLSNIFWENQDVALRLILIFSDGMENPPPIRPPASLSFSFYRVLTRPGFLDPSNWDALDKSISSLESFPDLRSARVTWYLISRSARHSRAVARYWEHVLTDLAKSPRVEVILN